MAGASSPFLVVLDEPARYWYGGFAEALVRSRELGMSVTFGLDHPEVMSVCSSVTGSNIVDGVRTKVVTRVFDPCIPGLGLEYLSSHVDGVGSGQLLIVGAEGDIKTRIPRCEPEGYDMSETLPHSFVVLDDSGSWQKGVVTDVPLRKPRPPLPSDGPMRPMDWLAYHGVVGRDSGFDMAACGAALSLQVGPVWNGQRSLTPEARILAFAFITMDGGDSKAAKSLLARAGRSMRSANPDLQSIAASLDGDLIDAYARTLPHHPYVSTLLVEALGKARNNGVLTTSEFGWLKAVDRSLWYGLNNVGRKALHVEGCGITHQHGFERGRELGEFSRGSFPDNAVIALQEAYLSPSRQA